MLLFPFHLKKHAGCKNCLPLRNWSLIWGPTGFSPGPTWQQRRKNDLQKRKRYLSGLSGGGIKVESVLGQENMFQILFRCQFYPHDCCRESVAPRPPCLTPTPELCPYPTSCRSSLFPPQPFLWLPGSVSASCSFSVKAIQSLNSFPIVNHFYAFPWSAWPKAGGERLFQGGTLHTYIRNNFSPCLTIKSYLLKSQVETKGFI